MAESDLLTIRQARAELEKIGIKRSLVWMRGLVYSGEVKSKLVTEPYGGRKAHYITRAEINRLIARRFLPLKATI